MYYVYDSVNDRILQSTGYGLSVGKEISFRGDCGHHTYISIDLLGRTPEEACHKVAESAEKAAIQYLDCAEKALAQVKYHQQCKIKALNAIPR